MLKYDSVHKMSPLELYASRASRFTRVFEIRLLDAVEKGTIFRAVMKRARSQPAITVYEVPGNGSRTLRSDYLADRVEVQISVSFSIFCSAQRVCFR